AEANRARGETMPKHSPRWGRVNSVVQFWRSGMVTVQDLIWADLSRILPESSDGRAPQRLALRSREMPTVMRIGSYRFFFYSNENGEPAHIHVQRDQALAKFWLSPIVLASSNGFSARELTKLSRLVKQHATTLMEAWNEFFGTQQ